MIGPSRRQTYGNSLQALQESGDLGVTMSKHPGGDFAEKMVRLRS